MGLPAKTAALLGIALATIASPELALAGKTLDGVRQRGEVVCGEIGRAHV